MELFGDHFSNNTWHLKTLPFANHKQRDGQLAFAKSLLNDQNWFEELWNQWEIVSKKASLFIWGMKDPIISHTNLEKFESGFSDSETVKLETYGHFPQEEEPEKASEAIRGLIAKKA